MIYDQRTILGLKLQSMMYLSKLSRRELLTRLQLIRHLDPVTDYAYETVEKRRFAQQLDDSPHGQPWHTSFHASRFPGDNPLACPRAALYELADFAPLKGGSARDVQFDRASRTVMDAGKAIEEGLVRTYADAGLLLSAHPDEENQTGFEWPEAWLTGSVDCVICWPNTKMAVPIEIKTKYQAQIDEMKLGIRGPDIAHVFQLKVQLALIHHHMHKGKIWQDYEPPTHGYLYYLSRDRPNDTAEFRFDLDLKFFDKGVAKLKQWIGYFHEDMLPEAPKGKRTSNHGHPMGAVGMRWSQQPCAWCNHKKTCQLDYRQGTTKLSESIGIERTKVARDKYDYEEARKRVLDRWKQ